ncbi:AcrR family transcriptional regulator [Naumannella cuiyingiana]|uniref:AcrR family transcriptional regulator n=1 Tax=Naumannella cuiyingiana TaxID=1347891 RepID=A0A7Z0ILE2_9ACTN|nr:TetR family transcriptional regulator C-terminal domain-containing protein [Naumannella cuiyingiana]NYI71540.1 AcrR family transcriptional regulator [Naumannella cuiyingiana]
MPKIVDADERLATIHEAVFRLVERGGVPAASLRNVANEAGLNVGSVRHYVGSHTELLRGAVGRLQERVTARLLRHADGLRADVAATRRGEIAIDMLEELVPLDAERRQEAALWQAFLEHARVHDDIGGLATEMAGGIREFTGRLLAAAGVSATAVPAEALACVLDGLAVATLHDPAAYDRRRVRAILRWQLTRTLT